MLDHTGVNSSIISALALTRSWIRQTSQTEGTLLVCSNWCYWEGRLKRSSLNPPVQNLHRTKQIPGTVHPLLSGILELTRFRLGYVNIQLRTDQIFRYQYSGPFTYRRPPSNTRRYRPWRGLERHGQVSCLVFTYRSTHFIVRWGFLTPPWQRHCWTVWLQEFRTV